MTATLPNVRQRLQADLAQLKRRADRIEDHQRNVGRELPMDSEDLASAMQGEEVVEALDELTHARIDAIEDALARLEAGVWGICQSCGDRIDPARLAAVPTARVCARCA